MMNIQNYEHQKLLLKHIRHTLKFAYHSPVRKQEIEERMKSLQGEEEPDDNQEEGREIEGDAEEFDDEL